jgi:hypothetical protein
MGSRPPAETRTQFPSGFYETNTPFSVKINCEQAANMPLSSGKVYRWEFPIRVPHDSPPYERCNSGRVYYRLTAKVSFAGGLLKKRPLVAEKVSERRHRIVTTPSDLRCRTCS